MAAHGAQLQQVPLAQDLKVNAFEAEFVLGAVLVPGIAPADAGTLFEAEGHDPFHQRQEKAFLRQLLHAGGVKEFPHFLGNDFVGLLLAFAVILQHLVERDGGQDLRHVLVVAPIAVRLFLRQQHRHAGVHVMPYIAGQRGKVIPIAADGHQLFRGVLLHAVFLQMLGAANLCAKK